MGEGMKFREPGKLHVLLQSFETDVLGNSWYRKYVESLGLSGSEQVLEYGPGPGTASKYLAETLGQNGGRLTCVDISSVWMRVLRKKLQKFPDVDYQLGDIASLPVPDNAYDGIVIHYVLHDIEAAMRAEKLAALVRKLKRGGKIYLREPISPNHGMPPSEIRALMAANGLKEHDTAYGRSMVGEPTFQAVYVK